MQTTRDGLRSAINRCGIAVYRKLAQSEAGNVVVSPLSLGAALMVAAGGARERTASEIAEVLQLPEEALESGAGLSELIGELGKASTHRVWEEELGPGAEPRLEPAYELSVANSVWLQSRMGVESRFAQACRSALGAHLEEVDFGEAVEARRRINGWIDQHTGHRIRDMVSERALSSQTRMVIANALYFKSKWDSQFKVKFTREDTFHCLDATRVRVPMMLQEGPFRYAETHMAQVLEMNYAGRDVCMTVVLPKKRSGLTAVEAELSRSRIQSWIEAFQYEMVETVIPRFEFRFGELIGSHLKALGVKRAFDSNAADFGRITTAGPLWLDEILHQAFVSVDENGTEAAAASAMMMAGSALGPPPRPKRFRADHPFLFLIRHRETGVLLFVGRVVDPASG